MTYEHRPGGYPASPDVDVGVPELCEKCSRDCPEPCEAFKRLEAIKNALNENYVKSVDIPCPMMDYFDKLYNSIEKSLEDEA